MNVPERVERLTAAVLFGLVAFAIAAHVSLFWFDVAPALLLPAALAAGFVTAMRLRVEPMPAATAAPRWLPWFVFAALAVATVAIAYGALATPSRHWDGAAAWDVRTFWLTQSPTLQQPFFTDRAVLSPARDYPLLQPLLVASGDRLFGEPCGRLWFPALFVLLALLVWTTLRRVTANPNLAWLGTGSALLTPMLVNPTSGGIDSGYADAAMLLCTTAIASGVLQKNPGRVFAGVVLAVLTKPEGVPYAAVAILACLATGNADLRREACVGTLIAGVFSMSVQRQLTGATGGLGPYLVLAAFGTAVPLLDIAVRRRGWTARARFAAFAASAVAALVLTGLVWRAAAPGGTVHAYLGDLERPLRSVARLPEIAFAELNYALLRGGFGVAYWFVIAALVAAWRRRVLRSLQPSLLLVASGLVVVMLPFVMSPEADLTHHLKSSMPRLLLHWVGPALLLGCAALNLCRRTDAAAP